MAIENLLNNQEQAKQVLIDFLSNNENKYSRKFLNTISKRRKSLETAIDKFDYNQRLFLISLIKVKLDHPIFQIDITRSVLEKSFDISNLPELPLLLKVYLHSLGSLPEDTDSNYEIWRFIDYLASFIEFINITENKNTVHFNNLKAFYNVYHSICSNFEVIDEDDKGFLVSVNKFYSNYHYLPGEEREGGYIRVSKKSVNERELGPQTSFIIEMMESISEDGFVFKGFPRTLFSREEVELLIDLSFNYIFKSFKQ